MPHPDWGGDPFQDAIGYSIANVFQEASLSCKAGSPRLTKYKHKTQDRVVHLLFQAMSCLRGGIIRVALSLRCKDRYLEKFEDVALCKGEDEDVSA